MKSHDDYIGLSHLEVLQEIHVPND